MKSWYLPDLVLDRFSAGISEVSEFVLNRHEMKADASKL